MKARLLGTILSIAVGSAVCGGCVGGSKETSEHAKERLKAYILSSVPAVPSKLNINFDNKVMLLGYKMEPASGVKPGQKVKLTLYWQSKKKLDEGWNLFTHVLDGSGERVLNIDNVGPLREWKDNGQALSPSSWDEGKVYVDEQEFTVPGNLKTGKFQVVTGVWKGNDRLKIVAGPHDRENRGIVANVNTGVAPARQAPDNTRVPMLRVDKLDKTVKIKIDGKLDEDAWKAAPVAGPFVDVSTGKQNPGAPVQGNVKLMWNDEGLYAGFEVRDSDIIGGFKKTDKDPHLWEKDTVELMIDPDGDGDNKDYYEIQINPQNLVFDSQFDDYNLPKTPAPKESFGHQDWSAKLKSAVTVKGTLDKPGDKDEGYLIEAFIPWKSFSKAKDAPPKLGDVWRVNFYAMQNNSGVGWSGILGQGNFHKASRFGRLLFAEKGWKPPVTRTVMPFASRANRGTLPMLRTPPALPKPSVPPAPAPPKK